MAIKIGIAPSKPALVFDNFFLEKLELLQKLDTDNNSNPYYTLRVYYRLFAVDDTNTRHFETKVSSFTIDDYAKIAYIKALNGDPDLANAAAAIESALAEIIVDQKPELGSATVV